jgi:hypothetical protein
MRKFWTKEQDDMIRAFYSDNTMETMKVLTGRTACSIYNRVHTLGLSKSEQYLSSPAACRLRRGDEIGKAHRFDAGHQSWNKGMKGWSAKGTEYTRFKKGTKPPNHRPVGYIRLTVDGYYEMKMAEGMQKFKLLHRVIWERCNGPIPKGVICIFLDGNTKNLEVTNLALMTKVQNMKRNSLHSYPKELAELIQLRGALNRQLNKRGINNEQPTA